MCPGLILLGPGLVLLGPGPAPGWSRFFQQLVLEGSRGSVQVPVLLPVCSSPDLFGPWCGGCLPNPTRCLPGGYRDFPESRKGRAGGGAGPAGIPWHPGPDTPTSLE